jgi:MYXO-CTERM domain-containing protein
MSQQPMYVALCVSLGLGVATVQAAPPGSPSAVRLRPRIYADLVTVTANPRDDGQVAELWQQAEHVLAPHDPALTPHTLAVTRATLERLRGRGIAVAIEPTSVQQMVDESYARQDQPLAADDFFSKVQQLEPIEARLTELVGLAGGRAKLVTIGKSIQGRDLRALLVSSRPDDAARASIIVTGAQHPREWLSPMVAMGIADGLVTGYDGDARVKSVVDNLNVYVVPVMNPDGYVRTFNGNRLQRKNMRPGCNVDTNRNFPTAFGQKASKSCDGETTSGAAPFSEPESQALRALAELQTHLRLYVDYHSAGNQVMIPYAYTQEAPPGLAKNREWGNLLASKAMLPARPAFALAQGAGGGALDWFREKYSDSLVVELPGRGFDPPSVGVAASVKQQWDGWLAVAERIASENPTAGGAVDGGVADAAAVADAGAAGSGADGGNGAMYDRDAGSGGSAEVDARGRDAVGNARPDAGTIGGSVSDAGDDPPAREHGGCAVAPGGAGPVSWMAFWALVALGLILRRRTRA